MKIGFIGAGKVGFTIGKLFAEGNVHVTGYYSRHKESAQQAGDFTNSNCFSTLKELVDESDAIFITVPDGQICSVYEQLKQYDINNKILCHCSGAMTSKEAFPEIEKTGAARYSIHPLFPVSSRYDSYKEITDAFFCLEGDERYMSFWLDLFRSLGLKCRCIEEENKVRYHAGCVVASNLVCGLMREAMDLLMQCGFEEQEALAALAPLANNNMQNLLKKGPDEALTGPVERNDWETVQKHMEALDDSDRALYATVSQKVLSMAKKRHTDRDYTKLADALIIKEI